jgi:hypothetical protein
VTKDGDALLRWSALPRTAAWFCAPAFVMIAGATVIVTGSSVRGRGVVWNGSIQAAAGATIIFLFPALALTPAAGVLTLVISRKRLWTRRVVRILRFMVWISIAGAVPATKLALDNYVYFTPRPAEAPPTNEPRSGGAAEQGDEADEASGGMVARMDMPPHARAAAVARGHRFAAYPQCPATSRGARRSRVGVVAFCRVRLWVR